MRDKNRSNNSCGLEIWLNLSPRTQSCRANLELKVCQRFFRLRRQKIQAIMIMDTIQRETKRRKVEKWMHNSTKVSKECAMDLHQARKNFKNSLKEVSKQFCTYLLASLCVRLCFLDFRKFEFSNSSDAVNFESEHNKRVTMLISLAMARNKGGSAKSRQTLVEYFEDLTEK